MTGLNDAIKEYNKATESTNPRDKLNYLIESEKYLKSFIDGNPSNSFAKIMRADVDFRITQLKDQLKTNV